MRAFSFNQPAATYNDAVRAGSVPATGPIPPPSRVTGTPQPITGASGSYGGIFKTPVSPIITRTGGPIASPVGPAPVIPAGGSYRTTPVGGPTLPSGLRPQPLQNQYLSGAEYVESGQVL